MTNSSFGGGDGRTQIRTFQAVGPVTQLLCGVCVHASDGPAPVCARCVQTSRSSDRWRSGKP